MIVISSSLVLTEPEQQFSLNNPIIGYDNLVLPSSLTATSEDSSYPASNLANESTFLLWDSSVTTAVDIVIETNRVDPIDYVGIARHNFATGQVSVTLEGASDGVPTYFELVSEFIPPDNDPLILRFTLQSLTHLRIRLSASGTSINHRAAVLYAGTLLSLQRRIYVGHTPLKYARRAKIVNGRSENGQFTGRIQLNNTRQSPISLKNLTPTWVRSYLDPFLLFAQEHPFFFAWRPEDYPLEAGFAWVVNDPMPSNQSSNGMMSIDIDMQGLA